MPKIGYLTAMFGHLNNLNSNMQGRNENIFTATDKFKSCNMENRLKVDDLDMFPSVRKNLLY